jgi:WXXGXW repeat (2 copies)
MRTRAALLAVVLLSGLCACVAEAPVRGRAVVDIGVRPPPPRVVVVPAARAGHVWAPGYWRWNGRRHVWVEGHWMRERRGWHWVPAHWEERRGRFYFEQGHWER